MRSSPEVNDDRRIISKDFDDDLGNPKYSKEFEAAKKTLML